MNQHPLLDAHHHTDERHGYVLTYRDAIGWQAEPLVFGAYKDTDEENTTVTLNADDELTVTLPASFKGQFEAKLFILNDGAGEGYKVSLNGGVGVADLKAQVSIYDDVLNTLVGFARITALAGAGVGAGMSTGSHFARIEGAIETTTAGTFLVEFAQNAVGASAGVHHEVGSSFKVTQVER